MNENKQHNGLTAIQSLIFCKTDYSVGMPSAVICYTIIYKNLVSRLRHRDKPEKYFLLYS